MSGLGTEKDDELVEENKKVHSMAEYGIKSGRK